MVDLSSYHSITDHLIARIPEISFILSSTFMIFAGDYLLGNVFVRSLKKMDFISRTFVFMLIGLIMFPALTTLGAYVLRELVLEPFKDWIILVLVITFLIVGILLSLRYNMKIKLKIK
jgi:hypothetical protein